MGALCICKMWELSSCLTSFECPFDIKLLRVFLLCFPFPSFLCYSHGKTNHLLPHYWSIQTHPPPSSSPNLPLSSPPQLCFSPHLPLPSPLLPPAHCASPLCFPPLSPPSSPLPPSILVLFLPCRYDNTGCGRSYLSQRDLEAHRLYRHTKDKGLGQSVVPTLSVPPPHAAMAGFALPPFFQPGMMAVSLLPLLPGGKGGEGGGRRRREERGREMDGVGGGRGRRGGRRVWEEVRWAAP